MGFEIDHVFVTTPPGARVADRLLKDFIEGAPNRHPGQGTENRRFFFRNAYVEFLFLVSEDEARSAAIQRTSLLRRCQGDEGTCPFGICVRPSAPSEIEPFESWKYSPPYLPPTLPPIIVATTSIDATKPMIFSLPWAVRPDRLPPERTPPFVHPSGANEISRIRVSKPKDTTPDPALDALAQSGLVVVAEGAAWEMELELDGGRRNRNRARSGF